MAATVVSPPQSDEVTREELLRRRLEFLRCAQSFPYFYFNYWHVEHPPNSKTPGWGPPSRDRAYQVEEAEVFQACHDGDAGRYQVRLKARQIGWTTMAMAAATWCAYFHPGHNWSVTSQRQEDAQAAITKNVRPGLERLPDWFAEQPGAPKIADDTNTKVTFHHNVGGKKVITDIISTVSRSGAGRSRSTFGAIFDEAAFVEGADDVFTALRPSVSGPLFVFSTANGMGNWFHDIWVDSQQEDSVWEGRFWPWDVVPERDDAWYELEKRAQRDKPWKFHQEYPSNPEEAFVKSGRVAFSAELLAEQDWRSPDAKYVWDGVEFQPYLSDEWTHDPLLAVWQEPWSTSDAHREGFDKPLYAVGMDVAEGLEHGDYTVIKVFNANTGEEAASLRHKLSPADAAEIVAAVAWRYNRALVGVELNNHGHTVVEALRSTHRYPNLYRQPRMGTTKTGYVKRFGWLTSRTTKPKMISDLAEALKEHSVTLHDNNFRQEASWFVSDGRGIYAATAGKHDDVVMATMIGWQVATDLISRPYEVTNEPDPNSLEMRQPRIFREIQQILSGRKPAPARPGYTTRAA